MYPQRGTAVAGVLGALQLVFSVSIIIVSDYSHYGVLLVLCILRNSIGIGPVGTTDPMYILVLV
jgi:hypothetical protein